MGDARPSGESATFKTPFTRYVSGTSTLLDTATRSQNVLGREKTLAQRLENPYQDKTRDQILEEARDLAGRCMFERSEEFERAALLAARYDVDLLPVERAYLEKETSKKVKDKWSHPKVLFYTAFLCGAAAIVQGMDQTAVNGAQIGYQRQFHIVDPWIYGLINGAPSLCCALLGCWTSPFLNSYSGRRGTIFISCLFAIASGLWQMFADSKGSLLAARLVMGLAIAFGIMLGFIVSVGCQHIHNSLWGGYAAWRYMLGLTAVPPFIVCAMTYFAPESPRWLISKGKFDKAFKSLSRLRNTRLQAMRDLYDIETRLKIERLFSSPSQGTALKRAFKLFTIRRNRRAAMTSCFLMFMQQFCGVNVIAYYSSEIFIQSGSTVNQALLVSMGTGIVNFVFAVPGMLTIDTRGRRFLLLVTFPIMAVFLFMTGFCFYIPNEEVQKVTVAVGIYLFMVVYSPGMGPVPFTYSAESYALETRDQGMSLATATCWGFNFVLALTFPPMKDTFTITGAFCFYAAWNMVALVVIYFFLPETKGRHLEQLDAVFDIGTVDLGRYYLSMLPVVGVKHRADRKVQEVAVIVEGPTADEIKDEENVSA
ncbi:hypothetical protein MBLNU459_g1960t1 [Dothideomycetes sp. NU459]